MKKIFITVILLFNFIVYADYTTPNTSVSWNLNDLVTNSGGTVTFSSGIYFINSNLTIAQSDTLKILSNATIKIALDVIFLVNGTFIVNPQDSVKLTSIDTTQKFKELRLDGAGVNCSFNKLIFEYSYNGFRLLNVSPVFTNCTFRYNCNGNPSTTVPALNLFTCSPIIQNCLFYRNHRAAIAGGSNIPNAPKILYSQFIENDLLNGNVPQINLGQSGSGTTIVRGCTIIGSAIQSGGIASLPIGTLNIIIENNVIKKNRYGITLTNANTNAIIRNNIIDSNNIQGLPNLGGSGININGNSTLIALVSKNSIRGNLWGITIQGTAKPVFGNLAINDTNYIGLNYIWGNGNSGRIYDLYNNTPDSIKAENNFWGTGLLDSIEAHIFHKPDSTTLGFVDYLPIFIPVGIQEITNEFPVEFKLYDAYPNPFNPQTNIKFSITQKGFTSLKIYDITGKEAAVLINDELNQGTYSFKYNASELASGIYFYKLQQGSFSV
ncbi:MAG: T9SS type A sorting domain-containing protein [Ignavibacteria bacterium]|nr:T9SS type A sorting domain-containing protein [Ignavibacteria bacterium]